MPRRTTRSRCRRRRLVSAKRREARQKKQGRWHRCGSRRAKRTHPRHALVCEQDWGTVSRNRDGRKRATRASGRNAHGTRCSRRTSKCISSHSTTTPSILVNGSAADVCHSCGDCGRERGESGEQRAPGTARAARTPGGPADLQDQVVQRVADAVVCGKGHAVSNGLAWTTHGAPAFEASESYSGRRTHLQAGKKMFRKRAARGAAGSRLQSAPGKWYVAAWCSE